ncbi:cytoplasmic tRNA 2-thiolation protein 2-A isoform X2 [Odontomachus brunneus]|uniref:cytoplasmic tRNA 2-thiolation protein 2-A isoform X2 n=1 Tax=Odontomachus brunneus TaxID=486640 RepID=UPI0013F24A92|nr:cytoplasmic tRNA 2-thiolation protein 2-A isoform X2 [Odontomachus brunneus]
MCSLSDYGCNNNDDKVLESMSTSLTDTKVCRKCKCKDVDVLLTGQSGYCNMCFLTVTNHKFRAALAGMSESTHKKLIFKTTVLYIDDVLLNDTTHESKNNIQCKIAEQTKNFGFDCYVVSLSQVLSKEDVLSIRQIDDQSIGSNNNDEQFREILTSLSDSTSRADFLDKLRGKLLVSAARKLNCNKVFVADSTMDIATKVLGDICLGRGAQLSTRAAFCDAQCADIKILKPMRDFTQQELIYYSECHMLNPVKSKKIEVTIQPATSIQALTYNFTVGLESQFSGTASTVMRTAEKLSAKSSKDNQDLENNCVLCNASLDSVSSDSGVTAMKAIEVSRLVSSKDATARTIVSDKENKLFSNKELNQCQSNNQGCCNNNSNQCGYIDSKIEQLTTEDVQKYVCYSCKLIFRNSDILSKLPASSLFAIQQRLAFNKMKDHISDFLL